MNIFFKPTKTKVMLTVLLFLFATIIFFSWLCNSSYSIALSTKCLHEASNQNNQSYIPQPLNLSTIFVDIKSDIGGTGCMGSAAYDPSSQLASNILTVSFFVLFFILSYLICSMLFLIPFLKENKINSKKIKPKKIKSGGK
jgi:hypothetical protein